MEKNNVTQLPVEAVKLGRLMAEEMKKRDDLEAKLESIKKNIKTCGDQLITLMQSQDIEKFKSSYGTVYINHSTRARVIDPDTAFSWLRSIGNDGLIKETVNATSLSSVVKNMLEDGQIILSDLESKGIDCHIDESIRILGREKGGAND